MKPWGFLNPEKTAPARGRVFTVPFPNPVCACNLFNNSIRKCNIFFFLYIDLYNAQTTKYLFKQTCCELLKN